MRWGMLPDKPSTAHNARTEDLLETSLWQTSSLEGRCLVPASGYWEWQTIGTQRKLFRIESSYDERQVFAGIWQENLGPTSGLLERSFAIVTTTANEFVAAVHNRMPVILAPSDYDRWLHAEPDQPPIDLLRPFPAEQMQIHEAHQGVGNVRNNRPELLNSQ